MGRTTDAFMSSADLQNIFKLEQGLVNSLRKYKTQLDKSLYDINHYVREVDELYKNENCYPPDQCEDHNYQMLKRLLVYWKIMEDNIKEIDIKKTLTELNKLKHKFGGMPQDRALQAAAKALIRLRST